MTLSFSRFDAARRGFTLIELLVAILLIAILTTLVGLSVGSHTRRAKLQMAADRIEAIDAQARQHARRSGRRVLLRFEEDRVRLEGAGLRDVAAVPALEMTAQPAVVVIEPSGRSESYRLRLTASESASLHLLTLGLTGQTYRFADAASLEAALQ